MSCNRGKMVRNASSWEGPTCVELAMSYKANQASTAGTLARRRVDSAMAIAKRLGHQFPSAMGALDVAGLASVGQKTVARHLKYRSRGFNAGAYAVGSDQRGLECRPLAFSAPSSHFHHFSSFPSQLSLERRGEHMVRTPITIVHLCPSVTGAEIALRSPETMNLSPSDPFSFFPLQSTLADEFLRDFGAPDDEEEVEQQEQIEETDQVTESNPEEEALALAFKKKNGTLMDLDEDTLRTLTKARTVHDLVKVEKSGELAQLLNDIEEMKAKVIREEEDGTSTDVNRVFEEDPEYEVIARSNDIMTRITAEIALVHRFVQDLYRSRWPELETLVLNPMDFILAVKTLGNDLQRARNSLSDLFPSASIISLSVAASNTQGRPLSDADLATVLEACDVAIHLDATRNDIVSYVESRMKHYAPNLSALIGSKVAAKLITIAGGLAALGRNVSGNLQAMGIAKTGTLNGMSTQSSLGHVGVIVESDLISRASSDNFKRAYRLVSGKCMIAARVDSFHSSPTGIVGAKLRTEIEKKMDKWDEPPPARLEKALPLPEFIKKGKHRAGKKIQAKKASYAMTELRKRANRVQFGQISEEVGNEPDHDLGMLSQEGHGLLRIAANLDNKGFKIKTMKEERKKGTSKRLHIARTTGAHKAPDAGPKQPGLRAMVERDAVAASAAANPLQARLDALKSNKTGYFSSTGGFTSVIKRD